MDKKKVVEFLLEKKGADFDIKNKNGKKPSELAYDCDYYDISDILLTKENEKYQGTIQEEKKVDIHLEEDMKEDIKESNKDGNKKDNKEKK